MAKKKRNEEMVLVGPGLDIELPPFPSEKDNNPDGVINPPNYSSDPSNEYGDRFCFTSLVAKGDGLPDGDVSVVTANGISSSRGQGKNNQYNFNKGISGRWNKNRDWDGGNLTGM